MSKTKNIEAIESDNLHNCRIIQVDPQQEPLRIDKFLMDRLERVTRNRLQAAIRAVAITVNEKEVKPNYKVRPNDVIKVILPRRFEGTKKIIPQDIPLDIRYEDDHILILHKPPGLVVHPGVGHRKSTLANALAFYYQNLPLLNDNYTDRPGLVHRIDKNTSGIMIAVKNDYAMDRMAKQFYYHTIERKYQAIIWGEMPEDVGTIKANVGRNPRHRKEMTVFKDGEDGRWAVTHWKTIEKLYYVSLIECQLETGRTHQIRVHMRYMGHPLFNDEKYGGTQIKKGTPHRRFKQFVKNAMDVLPRHALHAKSLEFDHPVTGERMYFESDLPEDMTNCLDKWRNYVKHQKELMRKG
ncbi:MAG: RluA family pseudouridine synthase [Bacteroidota bacterium]